MTAQMSTAPAPMRVPAAMAWMVDAACVDTQGLPWTADAWTVSQAAQASMRRLCAGCPVRAVCDAYAVPTTVVAGFWAGLHRGPLVDPARPVQLPLFDDVPMAG